MGQVSRSGGVLFSEVENILLGTLSLYVYIGKRKPVIYYYRGFSIVSLIRSVIYWGALLHTAG